MGRRTELINSFYDNGREDKRLSISRHGQLEYLTTMHYIHQYIPENANVLEVGAGTGRYSVALAKEGYNVTAVELAEKNFEFLKRNSEGLSNIISGRGDAVDLSRFPDKSFDLTLVLGPLYHLYDETEQKKALSEAVRVTKAGGTVIVAFLSVHAIIFDNYLKGNIRAGIDENFTEGYQVRHFAEQLFTGFNIDEFEYLFEGMPTEWITTAAADSVLQLAEGREDFLMTDADFNAFAEYHLKNCERRELLGCSSHLIYICRKAYDADR